MENKSLLLTKCTGMKAEPFSPPSLHTSSPLSEPGFQDIHIALHWLQNWRPYSAKASVQLNLRPAVVHSSRCSGGPGFEVFAHAAHERVVCRLRPDCRPLCRRPNDELMPNKMHPKKTGAKVNPEKNRRSSQDNSMPKKGYAQKTATPYRRIPPKQKLVAP